MNTMFAAVSGREIETAILRVLGFGRGAILLSFLIESTLVGLAGGVLGGVLAFAVARVPLDMPFLLEGEVAVRARDLVKGLGLAAAIGVLGGLLPALQASRMNVARTLG